MMKQRWSIPACLFVVLVASVSGVARARAGSSSPVRETRDLPDASRMRSTRQVNNRRLPFSPPVNVRSMRSFNLVGFRPLPEGSSRIPAAQTLAPTPPDVTWTQWGKNPQHTGEIEIQAQSLDAQLADIIYDPNVPLEKQDPNAEGDLLVHYQTALTDGDD